LYLDLAATTVALTFDSALDHDWIMRYIIHFMRTAYHNSALVCLCILPVLPN